MDTKIKPKNIEFKELTYTVPVKSGKLFIILMSCSFLRSYKLQTSFINKISIA